MNTLVEKTENFVLQLFYKNANAKLVYHNTSHTLRVVEKAKELAEEIQLNEVDTEKLLLAAWLHDVGYTKNTTNHEEESVAIAKEFLAKEGVSSEMIKEISSAILSTKMAVEAENIVDKLLNDADCSHLGSKNYQEFSELLHKETELLSGAKISDLDWIAGNIHFLTNGHKFYSDVAIKKWEKQKAKNIARLLKAEKKIKKDKKKASLKKEELQLKKEKIELPERGIETMFRVALRNHITLSDIADTKANILLSVNAIIISMALSTLLPKLDNPSNSYLIVPSLIFILFTVASIILSILATKPNVTKGEFTKEDVANKKVNLIFFGNFHKMSLPEFEWAMDEMMKDRDYLYGSLTKDLYFLGLVLNRKYNLLRATYVVFMIGIIVSVLAFAIAFYTQGLHPVEAAQTAFAGV
ncbi:Pycsar system effector family protein [Tenacibaculum geojense]|uniref:Pycsar system effector family protein n=1 Tax=Tenacibaculum geojense TaxID=915352 RepID=A0ABW3JTA9_9FLAO